MSSFDTKEPSSHNDGQKSVDPINQSVTRSDDAFMWQKTLTLNENIGTGAAAGWWIDGRRGSTVQLKSGAQSVDDTSNSTRDSKGDLAITVVIGQACSHTGMDSVPDKVWP